MSTPFILLLAVFVGLSLARVPLALSMLVAGLRLVHNGELDVKALLRAMSTRPAELLGLPGGTLRSGAPADVIVIDTEVPWVLDPSKLKSKCKYTPFDEARLQGRIVRTIVDGRTVYEYA